MTIAGTLACSMILDALFGEPSWLWKRVPHPAVLMGRLINVFDRQLNTGTNRKARGVLTTLILVSLAGCVGYGISLLGIVAEILVVSVLLAQKSLVQHVSAVANGLRTSLGEGRKAVSMIVSRDTTALDPSGVARSAIESAAENLSDGVIAPIFWYLIGGLPGIMIYKVINTADSMIGYRTPRHKDFGWASARLDDVLNLIPARLTAVILALVSGRIDLPAIRHDARKHRSPNAGWPEAALSRALGIALAGPRTYDGKSQDFPWVNPDGRKDLTAADIDNTVTMLWKAWGVVLALAVGAALIF